MLLTSDDYQTLSNMLDAFAVPMFAAERRNPQSPFRMLCVNAAHSARTGWRCEEVKLKHTYEILPPADAAEVERRYARCADLDQPLTFDERLVLKGVSADWKTTLQPITLPDGRQRIIGTAIVLDHPHDRLRLQDAVFFAAKAQMQMGKIHRYLELAERRAELPLDMRNSTLSAMRVARNIDSILDEIRQLQPDSIDRPVNQPHKPVLAFARADAPKA